MAKTIKNKMGREVISRDLIFDTELSDRDRFLYCYMKAQPIGTTWILADMAKALNLHHLTVSRSLKRLVARGWITNNGQQHKATGGFGYCDYVVNDERVKV